MNSVTPMARGFLIGLLLVCCGSVKAAVAQTAPENPDFTKGGKPSKEHDWTLGATGARGWIFTSNGTSALARQILITAVANGSPAAGSLQDGDVIVGVDGKPFSDDARIRFAQALTTAESDQGAGKLRLQRWRAGTIEDVVISLPVLGSYSATAPYDCKKSERILALGCASLAKRMTAPDYAQNSNAIPRSLNALALLAGGNPDHQALVRREARWAADFTVEKMETWYYGYLMTFLAEYVIATGDQTVMDGLKRLAVEAAKGQSGVGTWGHGFAMPNGNLNGYGCMNLPGMSLCVGMVLAREAGVKDPVVDQAIAKGAAFVRWYINKGAIPYGDHRPYPAHCDNGKNSIAAVLFDLIGDKEATTYFAKTATAAYSEREGGHTGNWSNVTWALFGVARGGPLATGAYLKETSWYYDLARGWDGQFPYQGSPVGEQEHRKYTKWDCSGSYLLAYAQGRKGLRLTGKKPSCASPFSAALVSEVIAAGRDHFRKSEPNLYVKRSTEELLAGLSSWSPLVRDRSADALGQRKADVVPALLTLLAGPSRDGQYGACRALGALGSASDVAAPQLRALLTNPDPWLQCLASEALLYLSEDVRKASVNDLLSVVTRTNPNDPRAFAARYAAATLFAPMPSSVGSTPSILANSLDGVDRSKLHPAVQALLQHQDSAARRSARKLYDQLTPEDLKVLLPAIIMAIENLAPSNEMFGDQIRLAGLDLISRLHIREGMKLSVQLIEPLRWSTPKRIKPCLEYLSRYGTHAKIFLPELKEMRKLTASGGAMVLPQDVKEAVGWFDSGIAAIESSTNTPTLISVADYITQAPAK